MDYNVNNHFQDNYYVSTQNYEINKKIKKKFKGLSIAIIVLLLIQFFLGIGVIATIVSLVLNSPNQEDSVVLSLLGAVGAVSFFYGVIFIAAFILRILLMVEIKSRYYYQSKNTVYGLSIASFFVGFFIPFVDWILALVVAAIVLANVNSKNQEYDVKPNQYHPMVPRQ